jgi:glycopeptide antibiotics resistance protein
MRKTRSASLCFLLTCLTIEVAQGLFLGRIFDVDDIVANLAGCFFGYGLWVILWKARSRYFASVDLNTYASLLLTVTFSLCGISYARFSILDVVLTSYGIPTWSGNDGWIISQSGIHYSNIFLIALLLIPLGMSIPVWRNRQTRLPAITALIAILAFSSLTVLQYYK